MSGADDDTEKNHDPTEKKLQDARKKGEIARSADISSTAAYVGWWGGLSAFGVAWVSDIGGSLTAMLSQAPDIAAQLLQSQAGPATGALLRQIGHSLLAGFAIPMVAVLLAVAAQNAFVFAPSKIKPKLSRISPIQTAQQKFGIQGLSEFAKSAAKLCLFGACLFIFLRRNMDVVTAAVLMPPEQGMSMLGALSLRLLGLIVLVAAGIAALDYIWQRAQFMKRNRMSHKELRDEVKDAEGDPHVKSQRRARAQEIAANRMMQDVPKADVVIVNPTHYAVALAWDRGADTAPVCVAKGTDEIARRIRETAQDARVPIHSDPPTARALFATVEVGQQIPPDHYAAVAAAIRFADALRQKRKKGMG